MGKMIIGPKRSHKLSEQPGVEKAALSYGLKPMNETVVDPTNVATKLGLTAEEIHAILDEKFKGLEKPVEAPLANMLPQQVVTVTLPPVVKEVSVITKDNRSRKYTKLVNEKLKRMVIHGKALSEQHEEQDMQIRNLLEIVSKLRSDLDKLDSREKALEAQIPEEIQEVTQKSPTLLYLGVAASILMSLASLILK